MKAKHMFLAPFLLLAAAAFSGCDSRSTLTPSSNTRAYQGTASVGDFLTISVDPVTQTITYKNYTNGETGTVQYTVNKDHSYTINDPNLLSAYEVPGSVMVIQAANAGPNKDQAALITAIESVPVTIQNFEGRTINYTQFRTDNGGVEIGTGSMDRSGNMSGSSYDPGAIMWQPMSYFNHNSASGSTVVEDPSGDFFTITDQTKGETMTMFGTQNGLFAIDAPGGGAVIGLSEASSIDFDSTVAGTYDAIYYEKANAQMQGCPTACSEAGLPSVGKATVTVTTGGEVTITDSQNNILASGWLLAIADDPDLYDGTSNKLSGPCKGLFTLRMITPTPTLHQETFVAFQSNAVIFSNFQTALQVVNNGTYTYFYGVGVK